LVALPLQGAPKGLVIYFHSTTAIRDLVPSRYTNAGGSVETEMAVSAFTSAGYAVAAPDYLGLGDDPGTHPYAIPSANYQSGVDMLSPTRILAVAQRCPIGSSLFVSGYSEGGAVAMWAAQRLQAAPPVDFRFRGSAPISGAYDLSGVELKSMLSGQSNVKWLAAKIYLAAYIGLSFTKLNPEVRLEQLFVPSFASYVPDVFSRENSDVDIIKRLAAKGLQLGAIRTIKRVLQPTFVRALEALDTRQPLIAHLVQENCFDWRPTIPLEMICLANDYLVPAENAKVALAAMQARGAGPDTVNCVVVSERRLDHLTFLPRGLALAKHFFDEVSEKN
jgi:pimeloyl-ACP methyl ester carboxylesterase